MERKRNEKGRFPPRTGRPRRKLSKYELSPEIKIEYKNLPLLQRFLTDRAKIVSRRVTGISAKQQRDLAEAIKRAKYLGLLPSGSAKKRVL